MKKDGNSVFERYWQFVWVRYEVITEKELYNEKFIDDTATHTMY